MWRILLFIGLPVVLTFVLVIVLATTSFVTREKENAAELVDYLASTYAQEIKADLDVAMDAVRTIAQIFENYESLSANERRNSFNFILKSILERNEGFLGVWTCWEPNALDGLDTQFANKDWYDATGRFVPYWSKSGGKADLVPLVGYDEPGPGDCHLIPKQTGQEMIMDPYLYDVGGTKMLMTSVVVPIKRKGVVVATAGIDIDLLALQKIIEKIRPFGTGVAALFSNNGIVVSHFDPSRLGKEVKITEADMAGPYLNQLLNALKNGEKFSCTTYSVPLKSDVTAYLTPFYVGNSKSAWSFVVGVPANKVFETANSLRLFLLIIGIVSVALITTIIFFVSRSITRPITALGEVIEKIKNKDLSYNQNHRAVKYLSRQDEIGHIVNALAALEKEYTDTIALFQKSISELEGSAHRLASISQEQLTSSEALTAQAQKVDENVQNTSASIEEVSSGVEEVAASAQSVSKTARELADQNEETSKKAKEGGSLISQVTKRIETATKQTIDTAGLVQKLAEGAKNVEDILSTISSIAEQTNLLALNAAIEAARAGEAGRGFAVVADEIRKLAEESKKATTNIARILKDISNGAKGANDATGQTVEIVKEVNVSAQEVETQFNEILKMVEKTTSLVVALTATSEEQGAAAEEMASAMDNSAKVSAEISNQTHRITQSAKQLTEGAQQVETAAEQLNNLSEALEAEIQKFKL